MRRSRALVYGTLVVGTLDALDAMVFFGIRNGSTPVRIFQSIASGALGRASFQGGLPSAALGVFFHYLIAFGIVFTYQVASRYLRVLTERPVLCGAVYGVGVYFFMNLVVIPLSAIGPQRFVMAPMLNGLVIHTLGIGIPAALFAAAAPPPSPRRGAPSRP